MAATGGLMSVAILCRKLKAWRSFARALPAYVVILGAAAVYSLKDFGLSLPEFLDFLAFLLLMFSVVFITDIGRRLWFRALRMQSDSAGEDATGGLEEA